MIDTSRVRVRSMAAAVGAIAAFAFTSTALANRPPKPVDPAIVMNESLGGVSIGQASADAQAAWVSAPTCGKRLETRTCDYGSSRRGEASTIASHGEVAVATIQAPFRHGEYIFKGPLMDFGTTKGDLGLGDSLPSIAKRYPGGKEAFRSLVFTDQGTRMTFFTHKRRITQIILADADL